VNGAALVWKYGLPGCTIAVSGDSILEWSGCSIEDEPTSEQVTAAEAEYDAWVAALALGEPSFTEWQPWANEDMDTGTESLIEWTAPSVDASWKVHGTIAKAGNMIAFEALVGLRCVTTMDDYNEPVVTRTVALTVQHTAAAGSAADVTWEDGQEALYTDYDAASGKIRLRANFASDNWAGKGQWQRATLS
jgi:metal-dependent amidase/aminoacylase/carboxypeptidase family protein